MSDAFAIPTVRRTTAAPLVDKVRLEVDAWRSSFYPGASGTTVRLLEHWFLDEHQTLSAVPFQYYFCQREAIETFIYLYEVAQARSLADLVVNYASTPVPVVRQEFPRYVFKMATGSGKTKVMALAVTWAYFHSLFEERGTPSTFLVVAPNLIVYERLRVDFEDAQIFRNDPMVPPEWRADFNLEVCLKDDPVPLSAHGVLALTNIQALYERRPPPPRTPIDAVLGPRPPAQVSASDPLLPQIARRGRIVVINDEAHHLHDQVKSDTGEPLVAIQVLQRLHRLADGGVAAQLDFSATPRNQQGQIFPETVVDYPLAQAIEDGIVKRPIIGELGGDVEVVSDDASIRYRQRIGAGVAKWREFRDALGLAGHKPLLFIMAEDTTAADQIAAYLSTIPDLAGKVLTIHVKMGGKEKGEVAAADLEEARRWAREVDAPDNAYAAIVSVLMLREGWDVRNVLVIVPLRAYTAKAQILPEQTLGRGLRRMTPPASGVDERLVVIEHEAFRHLWDDALGADGLTVERRRADDVHPEPKVVAVDPGKLAYDIAIPLLSRRLVRNVSNLGELQFDAIRATELPLPQALRTDVVEYTGRDLLSGEVVERSKYPLPRASDPVSVLAWYVRELQHDTRLTGQFAVLVPLVRRYIQERAFSNVVDLADPLVLQSLAEPATQEAILAALREAVDAATMLEEDAVAEGADLLLSSTKPFLWTRATAQASNSVFSTQPCDSALEVRFVSFLDRCDDVAAFAKLAQMVRFSLEYRAENGRLAYYYPDFVVRLRSGEHYVVETKGIPDHRVIFKDRRALRWVADATASSGVQWHYLRVNQNSFNEAFPQLHSFNGLLRLAAELRD